MASINSMLGKIARIAEATGGSNMLPGLVVTDHSNRSHPVCAIGKDDRDGSATLYMMEPGQDESQIVLKVVPDAAAGIHLRLPHSDAAQLQLNLFPTGRPAVLLKPSSDSGRIALTVDPSDGTPAVLLADSNGTTRASLELDPKGTPRLVFYDSNGEETWSAGQHGPGN